MATYYVRAIQEPSKKINADNLRCTYDDDTRVEVNMCYGDDRTARMMNASPNWKSALGRRRFMSSTQRVMDEAAA